MDELADLPIGIQEQAGDALEALTAQALEPFFRRPTRVGVDSAWYGHLPFAAWLVRMARPRVIVELGTHAGVSYAAFCEAVLQERLDTRCYAVDTWSGDEHAGFYGEEVYADFLAFHNVRYGGFSRLLRGSFDDALVHVGDGTVDLLHIDGRHRYEDVAHDFASWVPKLSPCAVVLLHDTNVRERDFGVWRFWSELQARHPAFEFLHAHGLGVLAVGAQAPAAVAALCRLGDPRKIGLLRDRFALLGERWALLQELSETRRSLQRHEAAARHAAGLQNEIDTLRAGQTTLIAARRSLAMQLAEARNQLVVASEPPLTPGFEPPEPEPIEIEPPAPEPEPPEPELPPEKVIAEPVEPPPEPSWRDRLRAKRAPSEQAVTIEPPPEPQVEPPPPTLPEPTQEPEPEPPIAPSRDERPRILFISGEPTTPGHQYRVVRAMRLAEAAGWRTDWSEVAPVGPHTLAEAKLVVLWRVPWSTHVQGIFDACEEIGARVLFDVDDLVFRPELARVELIDGIRSTGTTESSIASFFAMINRALDMCELTTCTTEELAQQVRAIGRSATVLPNGFDDLTHAASRLAARKWRRLGDGLIRIGYASGSRTHQRDFALVADAVARVLRARPATRLTVFRDPRSNEGVVLLHEFSELADLQEQIEWRDMVPLAELPKEMARFDVNLAPIETSNVFCEAKSELKYFEAALVDVVTIASPTGPMRRAMRDGETGFLVDTSDAWHDRMLALVDDPALRHRIARNAYHDALWRFGPQRREEMYRALLAEFQGGADAARAFELKLRRGDHAARGLPHVPQAETLFEADAQREAELSVIVPVYNYAEYVLEALESVRTQTVDVLDLVVIDDASTDDSPSLVLEWARRHANRFNRIMVRRHRANAGLGFTRNSGFAAAETPFVLPLDADNRLRTACCATLLQCVRGSSAAFAYPSLQQFGDKQAVFGDAPFTPSRLVNGNYIDAMALVAKWAWAAAGGYDNVRYGWEDYDFWCRLIELGLWGTHVDEVLAEYRVHRASMLFRSTDKRENKRTLIEDMHRRHPWLRIAPPA